MKKVIAVLIALIILGTSVFSYLLAKTDNELSATRIEKMQETTKREVTERLLATSDEKLTATEIKLIASDEKLTATEERLVKTEATLAATEEILTTTETKLLETEQVLIATEENLAETETALAATEKKLATNPTLLLDPPTEIGRINSNNLSAILRQKFPNVYYIAYRGGGVTLISKDQWSRFLATDNLNSITYSLAEFNCTEYAEIMQGRARAWAPASAFGIIVVFRPGFDQPGWYHYQNFFVDEKGEIWLVEPQNDAIFAPPENWQYLLILQ